MSDNRIITVTPLSIVRNYLIGKTISIKKPGNQREKITLKVADVGAVYDWEWRGFSIASTTGEEYDSVEIEEEIIT